MDINQIMASLEAKHPGELEYLQAVKEVLHSIEDIYNQHPRKVSSMMLFLFSRTMMAPRVPFGAVAFGNSAKIGTVVIFSTSPLFSIWYLSKSMR